MVLWYLVFILWFSVIYFVILFSGGVGFRIGFFLNTWIIYPLGDNFTLFGAIPFRSGFPPQTYLWYSGLSLSHSTPPRCDPSNCIKILTFLYASWRSYGCAAFGPSHATPSKIERREFCDGIKDTVIEPGSDTALLYRLVLVADKAHRFAGAGLNGMDYTPLCGCLYSLPSVLRNYNFVPPLTADCLIG